MTGYDAGKIEAALRLDRTPFNDELRLARADADKFARDGITVPVDADTTKARSKLDELKRRKVTINGSVDLSTKAADAKLDALRARADKTIGASVAGGLSKAPAWIGPALLALPAATTILGTAAGAATALGASLATGGIAFAAYGAVAKGVITGAATAATAVAAAQAKYNTAIAAGAKASTAYAAEQRAILLAYHGMSPAQVALSKQLGTLQSDWQGVEKSLTPVIAMSVAPWLGGVTSALKFAKPAVTDVSQVVNSLGHDFDAIVNLPSFAQFARFIGGEGSQVVNAGGGAILNFFQGFITLLPQFRPLISDVDQEITHLGTSFLTWAQSDSARQDIRKFMVWVHDNGPVVGHLLLAIGGALKNLGGGILGGPGQAEIRLLTGFFGLIAHLPPSFVKPVSDVAASLLIISRFSWGRKILSIGVNWVGGGVAALLKLISGGKIDLAGKFSASAGMQAAADTMLLASKGMQAAAATMAGAGAEGEAGAAGSMVGAAAVLAFLWGLTKIHNPNGTNWLQQGPGGPKSGWNSWDQLGRNVGNWWDDLTKGFGSSSGALAKAVGGMNEALTRGKLPLGQFAGLLDMAGKDIGAARTLTDAYTLAIQRNGLASSAAQAIRARLITDFTNEGLSAGQANRLVDAYTQGVTRNGDTAAAKRAVRAQLIADFEAAGETAKQAAAKVDTLIGQIASVRSKSVSLSVTASGSFTITPGRDVRVGTGLRAAAAGGLIRGQGGPTQDNIPAWLSNGEYVIKAAAVSRYGPRMFDRLNAMAFAGGGIAGTYSGSPPGLGAFETREWAATQRLIESADASAAARAIARATARARALMSRDLGPASLRQIEDWWMAAGGPGGMTAHIAAAITGAESAFNPGAVQQGQPYATTGWGLWQITPGDSEPQAGINEQLLNGPANAVAAVAKYRQAGSGFTPWTTYMNGAYLRFMGGTGAAGAPVRPVNPRVFDQGGWLPPGLSLVDNRTGGAEHLRRVRPGESTAAGRDLADLRGLLMGVIAAVRANADDTGMAVAQALGGFGHMAAHQAAYSARW